MENQLHWNRSGELSSGEEQRECHDGVPSQLPENTRGVRNIGVDEAIRLAVVIIRLDSDSSWIEVTLAQESRLFRNE